MHYMSIFLPTISPDRRPYNQILRCAADPQYSPTPAVEDLTMLYRPLFWTSYWCEDWIFSSGYRGGASSILISSASSKTAFSLAYLVGKRISRGEIPSNVKIIGLTSNRNVDFTKRLGLYHEVVEYDSFTAARSLQGGEKEKWIYVDVAGNDDLNKRIFAHFASPYTGQLVACVALGMTNLSPSPDVASLSWNTNTFTSPSAASSFSGSSAPPASTSPFWPELEQFFTVEWLNVRKHQLTPTEIFSRQNEAWKDLMVDCVGWVKLDRVYGANEVKRAYEYVAKGGLGPDKGFIWSLWEGEEEAKVLAKL